MNLRTTTSTLLTLLAATTLTAITPTPASGAENSAATAPAQPSVGWLSGRVLDFEGSPAAGAIVEIELPPITTKARSESTRLTSKSVSKTGKETKAKPAPTRFVRVQTDDRGRFHVGNLPDSHQANWTYPVRSSHPDFGRTITAAIVTGGEDSSITLQFRPFDGRPSELPVTIDTITTTPATVGGGN